MADNEVAVQEKALAPMTVEAVVKNVNLVQDILKRVMQKNIDYGVIPGCQKPSLFQPGAEKLDLAFRLRPSYTLEVVKDVGSIYTVRATCYLKSIVTDVIVGEAIAECSSYEKKYRRQDVNDIRNTIVAMATKRAHVRATRGATAASDVFDADVIDEPQDSKPVTVDKRATQEILESFSKQFAACKTVAALQEAWTNFTRSEEGEVGEYHFLDADAQKEADNLKNINKERLSK